MAQPEWVASYNSHLPSANRQPEMHTRSQVIQQPCPVPRSLAAAARLCIFKGGWLPEKTPCSRMVVLFPWHRCQANASKQTAYSTLSTQYGLHGVDGRGRQLAPTGPRRLGRDPTLSIAGQDDRRPYPPPAAQVPPSALKGLVDAAE